MSKRNRNFYKAIIIIAGILLGISELISQLVGNKFHEYSSFVEKTNFRIIDIILISIIVLVSIIYLFKEGTQEEINGFIKGIKKIALIIIIGFIFIIILYILKINNII